MGRSPGKVWQFKGCPAQEEQMASLSFPASWLSSIPPKEHTFIPSNWDNARRGLSARRIRKDFKPIKSMRLVTETWWEKKLWVVHPAWWPENPVGVKRHLSERQRHAHSRLSRHRNQQDPAGRAGRGSRLEASFLAWQSSSPNGWEQCAYICLMKDKKKKKRKAEKLLWIQGNQRDMAMTVMWDPEWDPRLRGKGGGRRVG